MRGPGEGRAARDRNDNRNCYKPAHASPNRSAAQLPDGRRSLRCPRLMPNGTTGRIERAAPRQLQRWLGGVKAGAHLLGGFEWRERPGVKFEVCAQAWELERPEVA